MIPVTPVRVGDVQIGGNQLVVIAGPCLAESYEICERVAAKVKELCDQRGFAFIFKASFDKANRTSGGTARGSGIDAGLEILQTISRKFAVPTTTDVHLPEQAARAAQVVDLLQVPAFLSRQTDLLEACARTGRAINVKKGQFLAPEDCGNIVAKLRSFNASGIILTERGTSFGYHALVVDMPGLETMRSFGVPVCFDATHSAQRPGAAGESTGGVRESIPAMTRAALAVGVDALFLEIHPDPDVASSDRATQWPLDRAEQLFVQIARVRSVSAPF